MRYELQKRSADSPIAEIAGDLSLLLVNDLCHWKRGATCQLGSGCRFVRVQEVETHRGLQSLELLCRDEGDDCEQLLVLSSKVKSEFRVSDGARAKVRKGVAAKARRRGAPWGVSRSCTDLGCVLVIIAATRQPDADTVRNVLDALAPDGGVQVDVQQDLLGTHLLARKLLDGLDGGRGTVLEALAVDLGVQVDCVLPGDDVGEGRTGLALRGVLSARHGWQKTVCMCMCAFEKATMSAFALLSSIKVRSSTLIVYVDGMADHRVVLQVGCGAGEHNLPLGPFESPSAHSLRVQLTTAVLDDASINFQAPSAARQHAVVLA